MSDTDNTPPLQIVPPVEAAPKPIEFVPQKPIAERVNETQSPQDAALEFSIFEGGIDLADSGKPVYSFIVDYHGYQFYCRWLDDVEAEYVTGEDSAMEAETRIIKTMTNTRLAKEASFALAARSKAKDRWIVDKAVLGWEHESRPLPEFNDDSKSKVGASVWHYVASAIYGKSVIGRSGEGGATNF